MHSITSSTTQRKNVVTRNKYQVSTIVAVAGEIAGTVFIKAYFPIYDP